MKRALATLVASGLALGIAGETQAFSQETHKRIVIDAVNYMRANPTTTNYNKLAAAAARAGYTVDQMAQVLGQGAYDVDNFQDTYICGAVTGDCVHAPLWGLGTDIAKYTSFWHFQSHVRGADVHGNDKGGYDPSKLVVSGDIDDLAESWLYGDYLDDGRYGMGGWFGDGTKYNTYGITEANYRQGSYSSKSMYDDYEHFPFQPIDNLGQYWYSKFQQSPTFQTLGFVLHTTDLVQPHHTWNTLALNHSGWEGWINDYYYSAGLNNSALVTAALADFTPIAANTTEIRPLLTQGGAYSYANGGSVLYTTDHAERVRVAKLMVPHAIAMAVRVLDHAANRF
ncbi:MAG: phospholipase [Pseudomonadota bacterium]